VRRIVDLHPSSSNGRVTRPVVGRRLDRAGGTCSLAQRVRRASLVGLRSHGVRQLGTHLHMKLRPAQLRPLRPLRCCRRGPGRPSRCQVSHNSESGWGEERMFSWRLKACARHAAVAVAPLVITTAQLYSCAGGCRRRAADLPWHSRTRCGKAPSLWPPSRSGASARHRHAHPPLRPRCDGCSPLQTARRRPSGLGALDSP